MLRAADLADPLQNRLVRRYVVRVDDNEVGVLSD